MTIANAWFFMSALGTDLLWLRFYLFMAYVFLLIAGLTNYPPWPLWNRVNGDVWLIGGIVWPLVIGELSLPASVDALAHHIYSWLQYMQTPCHSTHA